MKNSDNSIPIVLVGNKADLREERVVPLEMARQRLDKMFSFSSCAYRCSVKFAFHFLPNNNLLPIVFFDSHAVDLCSGPNGGVCRTWRHLLREEKTWTRWAVFCSISGPTKFVA